MKIKVFSLSFAAVLLIVMIPIISLAANHLLTDGDSLDISTCVGGYVVTVTA